MARVSVKAAANTAESRGRQAATISRQARIDIPAGRLIAAIVGPVAQPDPGFGASSAPSRATYSERPGTRQIHSPGHQTPDLHWWAARGYRFTACTDDLRQAGVIPPCCAVEMCPAADKGIPR